MSVLVETTLGDLVFDLYTEERPRSCMNFLKLCKIKYYNFCCFHSVRRNFIAQSGDPTETGRGGVSVYSFVYGDQAKYFELELKPRIKHRTKGTISFVNNGNDMHGSQFFITLGDGLDFLDGKHTVFGQLAEGFDVLEKLNEVICDDSHKPFQDVRITHTIVLEDPFDDPKDLPIPDKSPEPTKEVLESGRIAAGEKINDDDVSKEELLKKIEDKELAIGTKILETVGDIDDADLKPPENVLFVCKLNPVTNADDLKIIFSRFGKILSCEIIKDQKTGDSLCYGFVEFKEVEACEKAYFKMDNVLIDDRRIHVDFCQSVSKINKWHKSAAYTKANSSKDGFGYEMKEKKNPKDKYSMIFDDEDKGKKSQVQEKNKKKDSYKSKKKSQKRRSDSSDSVSDSSSKSIDDKRSARKKTLKSHKKRVDSKNDPKKSLKRNYSSSDDDDDDVDLKTAEKKKKNEKSKKHTEKSSDDSDSDDCDIKKSKTLKESSKNLKESSKYLKESSKYSNSDSEDSDHKQSKKFQEEFKKKKKAISKNNRDDIRKTISDDDKKNEFSRKKNDHRSSISKEKRDVRSSSSSLQKRDARSSLQKEKKTDVKEQTKYSDDSDESVKNEKREKKFKKISLEECDTEEYTGEKSSNKKNNRSEPSDSDDSSDEDKKKSRDYKKHTKRHSEGNKKRKKRNNSTDSSD
ncbi:peptidyl-prolyl cis-trans isomerase sig-7 isoform X1 [Hydra vulgaris]|uniref:Peptidyl-prolyl cis-trans isomerase n=1 Tax=Hydra vulgaris TaxID=6087 RepID=T2M855_HYDVU|nr:peptidyl-prolyl cis-trans isomerase sig-7-like [Hydra vulgaris]